MYCCGVEHVLLWGQACTAVGSSMHCFGVKHALLAQCRVSELVNVKRCSTACTTAAAVSVNSAT